MFKHILVPIDLTERNREAMEIAVEMGVAGASQVTLLHVVETIEDAESEELDRFYGKLASRASKVMDRLIVEFNRDGLSIGKAVIYGKRVREILKFADENAVDLIIMSSHRLEPEDATQGWGTISFKVGVLSHCPVMLVK